MSSSKPSNVASIAGAQVALRLAAAVRAHDLPEERVVRVPAAVVAHGRPPLLRQQVDVVEHLLERPAVPLGALDRLVQVVDVGLVVLVVVEPHRLLVDVRLERVVGVRKRRQLIRHGPLLSLINVLCTFPGLRRSMSTPAARSAIALRSRREPGSSNSGGRRPALDPEHHRLRDFLTRIAQPYEWFEAGTPEAEELLTKRGLAGAELPLVIDGGDVYTGATVASLAEAWHCPRRRSRAHYDLAIVGAGPAGLGCRRLRCLGRALDGRRSRRDVPGGQASHTSMIENFFGFPDGIGGAELARRAGRQAERFGAELVLLRGVVGSRTRDGRPLLRGRRRARAHRRRRARRHRDGVAAARASTASRSCSAAASTTAPAAARRRSAAAMPWSWSAPATRPGQAVMNLADAGARVTMVVRGDALARSMSAYLVERIERTR